MPTSPLPDELRDFLAKPNPSVIATLRPDGQPVTVPTWYVLDGDRILVNMDAGRKRVEHLRRDPRVSLTVMDDDSCIGTSASSAGSPSWPTTLTCPGSTGSRRTTSATRTAGATGRG